MGTAQYLTEAKTGLAASAWYMARIPASDASYEVVTVSDAVEAVSAATDISYPAPGTRAT